MLANSLRSGGCVVLEAEDGPSAIRMIDRESSIELLLTDVVLPGGVSGVDVGRYAAEHQPQIRKVFMSGYGEHEMKKPMNLDSLGELLMKPFHLDVLIDRITECLE